MTSQSRKKPVWQTRQHLVSGTGIQPMRIQLHLTGNFFRRQAEGLGHRSRIHEPPFHINTGHDIHVLGRASDEAQGDKSAATDDHEMLGLCSVGVQEGGQSI